LRPREDLSADQRLVDIFVRDAAFVVQAAEAAPALAAQHEVARVGRVGHDPPDHCAVEALAAQRRAAAPVQLPGDRAVAHAVADRLEDVPHRLDRLRVERRHQA
jgi:hypothetical protein